MYLNHTVAVSTIVQETYSLHLLDKCQAGQSSKLLEQHISGIWQRSESHLPNHGHKNMTGQQQYYEYTNEHLIII